MTLLNETGCFGLGVKCTSNSGCSDSLRSTRVIERRLPDVCFESNSEVGGAAAKSALPSRTKVISQARQVRKVLKAEEITYTGTVSPNLYLLRRIGNGSTPLAMCQLHPCYDDGPGNETLTGELQTLYLKVDDSRHELRHRMNNRKIRDLPRIAADRA
jgi:hypothetical protein